jgi:hypothetical protein
MTIPETVVPADVEVELADKPTVAFPGGNRVWLAAGLRCSHCGRPLHAGDVAADFGDVTMICTGCHRDILTIRSSW